MLKNDSWFKSQIIINIMSNKFNPSNLKNIIGAIDKSRGNIAEQKNLNDNFNKLKDAFEQAQPHLKSQSQYIKNFYSNVKDSKSEQGKAFQSKRHVQKLMDLAKGEIFQILQNGNDWFSVGKRDRRKDKQWQRLKLQLEKNFVQLKQRLNQNNRIQLMMKVLNVRDNLFKQMLKSLLYRKNVLWLDLNVPFQPFVHAQIKSILNSIKELNEKQGYVPSLPDMAQLNFDQQGRWQLQKAEEKSQSLPSIWHLVNNSFEQMLETIRNYSNLGGDKQSLDFINKNQKVVMSLRQQIQSLHFRYNDLQNRFRQLQTNARPQEKSSKQLKDKIQQLEIIVSRKQSQINQLRSTSSNSVGQINALKQKIKQVEQENHHIHSSQIPKLREMDIIQQTLNQTFNKLRKQVDTYSTLFKIQSQSKNKLMKQLAKSQQQVQGLVKILQRERCKNKDQRLQIEKTQKKCLQIMRARDQLIAKLKQYNPSIQFQ